jgi:hypothetical protein
MLTFIDESSDTAFQPDELRILTAAFDEAWEVVQASGARFETGRLAVAARTIIAKHIIDPRQARGARPGPFARWRPIGLHPSELTNAAVSHR